MSSSSMRRVYFSASCDHTSNMRSADASRSVLKSSGVAEEEARGVDEHRRRLRGGAASGMRYGAGKKEFDSETGAGEAEGVIGAFGGGGFIAV
jgi:hypothetical protein